MTLDTQLVIDAMSKLFDEFTAGLFKQDVAREASMSVPVPTQSATVGADVVADNWGDLFDGGDDFVEQFDDEPIVADNWGGLFEQPAHFQEERDLEFSDALACVAPAPESCLTSTESDMLAGVAPAVSSSSSSAPAPAPAARAADEEKTTSTTPTRCSTQVPTPTPALVNNAAALVSSSIPPTNSPTMCSTVCLSQQRYITTSTSAYSIGVVLPRLATKVQDAQKASEGLVVLNPVLLEPWSGIAVDMSQGPSILNSEQVYIPPKPPWSLHCLHYDTSRGALMPWTPLSVLPDIVQLRPIPWPSFTSQIVVVQWNKLLPRMFCDSVTQCIRRSLNCEFRLECSGQWLEFLENALLAAGFIWVHLYSSILEVYWILFPHCHDPVLRKLPYVNWLCIDFVSCCVASSISSWKSAVGLIQLSQDAILDDCGCYQLLGKGISYLRTLVFLVMADSMSKCMRRSILGEFIFKYSGKWLQFLANELPAVSDSMRSWYMSTFAYWNAHYACCLHNNKNISGDCLQYYRELYGNAVQLDGTKWKGSVLSQFIVARYCCPNTDMLPIQLAAGEGAEQLPTFERYSNGGHVAGSKEVLDREISVALHCNPNTQQLTDLLLTSIMVNEQLILWDPGDDHLLSTEFVYITSLGDLQRQDVDLSFVKRRWMILLQFLYWWRTVVPLQEFLQFQYYAVDHHGVIPDALIMASLIGQQQVLLVNCQLCQQCTDGSWCYTSEVLFRLFPSSSHWTQVQMTGMLYLVLIAEFLFPFKMGLLAASIVEIETNDVTRFRYLQAPWDPGGFSISYRLGGKPNFKKAGMSGMRVWRDRQMGLGCQPELCLLAPLLLKLGRTGLPCLHAQMGRGPCNRYICFGEQRGEGYGLTCMNCSSSS